LPVFADSESRSFTCNSSLPFNFTSDTICCNIVRGWRMYNIQQYNAMHNAMYTTMYHTMLSPCRDNVAVSKANFLRRLLRLGKQSRPRRGGLANSNIHPIKCIYYAIYYIIGLAGLRTGVPSKCIICIYNAIYYIFGLAGLRTGGPSEWWGLARVPNISILVVRQHLTSIHLIDWR
jgi:hypothetical protein